MSQRLMLTALKSARLNGVPFGGEERKKKKKKEEKVRPRDERGREKKIKTN